MSHMRTSDSGCGSSTNVPNGSAPTPTAPATAAARDGPITPSRCSPTADRRGAATAYNHPRAAAFSATAAAAAARQPYGLHQRGGGDDAAPVPHHIRSRVHGRAGARGSPVV
ncbi:hypothetical protein GPECTOR_2g1052 [Gonium pectorale]|uniref:Uncharacterized protein n=1 Tax=Gonium pectorale TaxID=33097 RepID=A0A150H0H5_GONPE|nr:hypothetical protein GPECTOR_2g1052 [Gonium pectorale]|eukprot:KXZ55503.1 hypothetical protein GPECTOR_2g1052 [Gonium pectorale]